MGIEELGLGLSTTAALAIPPPSTVGVQGGTAGTLDGNLGALDLQKRAVPLLVAPGSLTLEDDLLLISHRTIRFECIIAYGCAIIQVGEVECSARGYSDTG